MGTSGAWLRWLCEKLCGENRMLVEKPAWLEGTRVELVDGRDESEYGSSKSDFRLH
jgi:hypothetical protein